MSRQMTRIFYDNIQTLLDSILKKISWNLYNTHLSDKIHDSPVASEDNAEFTWQKIKADVLALLEKASN